MLRGGQIIDIGCGEGWVLHWFYNNGWNVKGLDYSAFGIGTHNPEMLQYFCDGDIYKNLKNLNGQFDIIWLQNVLEHVLNPKQLLLRIKHLMMPDSILMIQVPNDFSVIQHKLLAMNCIDREFWITAPDHISYFNRNGLENLCSATGLKKRAEIADFPIDFNLFNPDTNYVKDKSRGRNVHLSRVLIENMLDEISPQKTVELYKILGAMGLGRELIHFYSLA
jgi:SAM-dependent methyltransferase